MKTCPQCGVEMEDSHTTCPVCGADYLQAAIAGISGSARNTSSGNADITTAASNSDEYDASLLLSGLEEGLRVLDTAALPTLAETLAQKPIKAQIYGSISLFGLIAGFAAGAPFFYILAVLAAIPCITALIAHMRHCESLGNGEKMIHAAARIFTEDATSMRSRFANNPTVIEQLDAMQQRIDQAFAIQAKKHASNAKKIRIIALVLLILACIGAGTLAIRNHAARKAEAEYAAQPEWIKLRDSYLATATNDVHSGNSERFAVVQAMLNANETTFAEEFFFAHCQGKVGDIDCALLIANNYRKQQDYNALNAFADKVKLRYDSDTRKIQTLKR